MLDGYRTKGKLHAPAQVTLYQTRQKVTPSLYPQDTLNESLPCHLYPVIIDPAGSSQLNSHINILFFTKEKHKAKTYSTFSW